MLIIFNPFRPGINIIELAHWLIGTIFSIFVALKTFQIKLVWQVLENG